MDSSNSKAESSASSNRFDRFEETLEAFQENARQIAVIVSDFQPKSQDALNHKLQTFVSGLQELEHAKQHFTDVRVPIELLDVLDASANPEGYSRDTIERTLHNNQRVNGKINLYKKFRAQLLAEMAAEMPAETLAYRSMRERKTSNGSSEDKTGEP